MKNSKLSGKQIQPKTPREYLSWTQFDTFKRSPEQYRKVYLLGQKFESPAMDFGKRFADALEHGGKATGDPDIDFALDLLPRYPKHEHEIRVVTRGLVLMGKMDAYDPKKLLVAEYKTGKATWTQDRVDKHGQLTFYTMLHYLKYGKMPKEWVLHWYDTANTDITTYRTARTLTQVLEMTAEARRVWEGIINLCKQENYGL